MYICVTIGKVQCHVVYNGYKPGHLIVVYCNLEQVVSIVGSFIIHCERIASVPVHSNGETKIF